MSALDTLPPERTWALGGGTALALRFGHRISYDIDIFFENSVALRELHPNSNPAVKALSDRFQNPGNYIKIERPEGEIDFLAALRQTEGAVWSYRFDNREIPVETPAEILAKKLHYRGSKLVVRDGFDIAAAIWLDPPALATAIRATPDGASRAVDRIEKRLVQRFPQDVGEEVNPTADGERFMGTDLRHVARWIRDVLEQSSPS